MGFRKFELLYSRKFLQGFIFAIFANGLICEDYTANFRLEYISAHSRVKGQ